MNAVLIPKQGRDPELPKLYRSICVLDTLTKTFEALLRNRLEQELEQKEGLADQQYGFWKGRSTTQAMLAVRDAFQYHRARWKRFVKLNVRNAFNSASWTLRILSKLRQQGTSEYLQNIISAYLQDRSIQIPTGKVKATNTGVPQGLVLGPTL